MRGAIIGDVIGSAYEGHPVKHEDFELFVRWTRFTDDTVLTVALADHFLSGRSYEGVLRDFTRRYPHAGFGSRFRDWALNDDVPSPESWGNGSAMRVSPVGYVHETLDEVIAEARASAMPTHGHPGAVAAAEATAAAIFLARTGKGKEEIRTEVARRWGYDLDRRFDDIQPGYRFSVKAATSVPEAIIAFLAAESFEDTIRKAVSLGGDADTQAAIAGGIAEAFYGGVPEEFWNRVAAYLPEDLLEVTNAFCDRYPVPGVKAG